MEKPKDFLEKLGGSQAKLKTIKRKANLQAQRPRRAYRW